MKGMFSIKEAYGILAGYSEIPQESWRKRIWLGKLWPNAIHFLWLIRRKKAYNMGPPKEKGFVSPSWCRVCKEQKESTKHLLNTCVFVEDLWNESLDLFGNLNHTQNRLWETLESW